MNALTVDSHSVNASHKFYTRKIPDIPFKKIAKYFCYPIVEAAQKSRISETLFKKKCRLVGISRWPYRKIKSLLQCIKIIYFNNDDITLTKIFNIHKQFIIDNYKLRKNSLKKYFIHYYEMKLVSMNQSKLTLADLLRTIPDSEEETHLEKIEIVYLTSV